MGKKAKKQHNWEIIKGPIQPDSKQCGYYVLRFMKEIVDGFKEDGSVSLKSLFQKKPYSKDEINEVRVAWANCVSDHL
ncbi:hypothetical protein C2S52_006288 [Perilla frutescens var. hirtella]|nr:hypothetical protein C2S51_009499 [Perilla frutescens var. frutescens]KAH6786736.1 hypothetical protein C2S52_006288 [Perilla frutescens var. hirtella]